MNSLFQDILNHFLDHPLQWTLSFMLSISFLIFSNIALILRKNQKEFQKKQEELQRQQEEFQRKQEELQKIEQKQGKILQEWESKEQKLLEERKKPFTRLISGKYPFPVEMITHVVQIDFENCDVFLHQTQAFLRVNQPFEEVVGELEGFIRSRGQPKIAINTNLNVVLGKTMSGSFSLFFEGGEGKPTLVTRNYASNVKKVLQEKKRILKVQC